MLVPEPEMNAPSFEEGFADGLEFAVRIVQKRLSEAMQEPRRRPSDRAGRICALGNLIAELGGAMNDLNKDGDP